MSMNDQIEQFYTAFQNQDAEKMVACYHDDIVFEDPAFGILKGEKAKNMWRMLCANSKDLNITFSNVETNENSGKAHWEARYTFSKTGRKVHNVIDAEFEFSNGKIIKHNDNFDLHKWAKQALGFKGLLLGGTSFFKKKLNQQTNSLLTKFEQNS
jgi:ketosteroid isomerase-like protein